LVNSFPMFACLLQCSNLRLRRCAKKQLS
jgi:hypothetical protein